MADGRLSEAPSAEEAAQVGSLVTGRSKRTTAGRHMSALLNAEADDELALLFEETEDDNDFFDADGDAGDEDDMLESSDDDDQGPAAHDDDFEGEQELQKEAKAEGKKRKKQQVFNLQTLRKKVKIDPAAVSGPGPGPEESAVPRQKKKSERISWIPTVDEGPTRSSSRRQTMHNKELTHARLKDSEVKRVKLIATMEEAAKRKSHIKPKEMTQADRLLEAERVERHNSKSLNRWEETEKRKAEERQARIEALQNRRLEGPVMSYWSGVATWVNGRLTRLGKVDVTQKPKEENNRKKSKKPEKEDKNDKSPGQLAAGEVPTPSLTPAPLPENAQGPGLPEAKQDQADFSTAQNVQEGQASTESGKSGNKATEENPTPPVPIVAKETTPTQQSTEIAHGAPAEAVAKPATEDVPKEPTENIATGEAQKGGAMDIDEKPQEAPKEPGPEADKALPTEEAAKAETVQQPTEIKADDPKEPLPSVTVQGTPEIGTSPAAATAAPAPAPAPGTQPDGVPTPTPQEQLAPEIHMDQPVATNEDAPPGISPPPPIIEETGRTLTVLENFDDRTAHNRDFSIYFNAKKPARLTKISSSLCVITSLPSRYRDPDTSLPFANSYAHKEIGHTVDQRYTWSTMLGCYVGPAGVAARGVPERFLGGSQAVVEEKGRAEGE